MTAITINDRILGALIGAAAGDAMGAATEMKTTAQIKKLFGGWVREFLAPPADTFARGRQAGQITDDFSLAYYLMEAMIRHQGIVTSEMAQEALLDWAAVDAFFIPFAGPTTRASILVLKGEASPQHSSEPPNYNAKATNGAAMKIFPVGLLHPGDPERAIEAAVTVSMITHDTHLAISGACAIAAAVSAAAGGVTLQDVLEAARYGAEKGARLGREHGRTVAGPSVEKRIPLAVQLAQAAPDVAGAMESLSDLIGTGIHVAEAVPAAIGLLAASKGDPVEGIVAGVNIGNDTDTIATMVGAVAGALNGSAAFPQEWLPYLNRQNELNLSDLARRFGKVMKS
jgi:ADP-ribosylglycohydrolase